MKNLTSLDSRYHNKVKELSEYLSDFSLNKYRTQVEIEWLIFLSELDGFEFPKTSTGFDVMKARNIVDTFNDQDYQEIKSFEKTTNHDVKAVEYFVSKKLEMSGITGLEGMTHFACTSEDINNVSYALMCKDSREKILLPAIEELLKMIADLTEKCRSYPMLSRTHGQPASPTTMGKEMYNFYVRLSAQADQIRNQKIQAKFNGAVGNFNAHRFAYPDIDWQKATADFINHLGLTNNPATTQIEPHDWLSEYFHTWMRWNNIALDLCRDTWGYISLGYFRQITVKEQTGSSTMPHKINPIDFENAEGNVGLANALMAHMSDKLQVSRWQRDLSDSTVLRNIGSVFGYVLLSVKSLCSGLAKIEADTQLMEEELSNHPEILGEAIQTQLRAIGFPNPYELLKDFTRGKKITQELTNQFIHSLELDSAVECKLLELRPSDFIGYAAEFPDIRAKDVSQHV